MSARTMTCPHCGNQIDGFVARGESPHISFDELGEHGVRSEVTLAMDAMERCEDLSYHCPQCDHEIGSLRILMAAKPTEDKGALVRSVVFGLKLADPDRYEDADELRFQSDSGSDVIEWKGRKMDVSCDSPLALLADIHKLMS